MGLQLASIDDGAEQGTDGIAIPPRPELLAKIAAIFPNTEKVTALIADDPDISASVLKVVNSPCIGMSRPVEKLEQAVVMLGLDGVMNVVNAVLLHSTLNVDCDSNLRNFWKNTKTTAAAAGMLANEVTGVKPDDAYLLGLFRDCAIPLIYQKFPHYFGILEQGYQDQAARIISIEDKQIKANHAVVGHLIARAWQLPPAIVQAVNDHHSHRRLMCQSANQVEQYTDRLVATLKLAEHVSHTCLTYGNIRRDHEWEIYKKPILNLIDKPPQDILDVVNNILQTLKETDELL